MTRAFLAAAAAIVCLSVLFTGPALAQSNPFNERDDQYRLLGLKRAKEAFEIAREAYERNQKLFQEGIIAENAMDNSRRDMSEAEVTLIATINGAQQIAKDFYLASLLANLLERIDGRQDKYDSEKSHAAWMAEGL